MRRGLTLDAAVYMFSFYDATAHAEIYTLSLHDALPISQTMQRILVEFARHRHRQKRGGDAVRVTIEEAGELAGEKGADLVALRSEEHTSELQSLAYLVCRLLLEKKNLLFWYPVDYLIEG